MLKREKTIKSHYLLTFYQNYYNMKKLFMIAVMGLMAFSASAQNAMDDKGKTSGQPSDGIAQVQLANQLAQYGYDNSSASALIEAAAILVEVGGQDLQAEYTRGEGADVAGERVAVTPTQLIADAKRFAEGDKTLLAMADKVKLNGTSRGAVGGPKRSSTYVLANSTDVFTIRFRGDQLAEVFVSGDGDTDLDLYVYDENNNLIESDVDYTDQCYVSWTPAWTGPFKVKVVNRGRVRNYYTIWTN